VCKYCGAYTKPSRVLELQCSGWGFAVWSRGHAGTDQSLGGAEVLHKDAILQLKWHFCVPPQAGHPHLLLFVQGESVQNMYPAHADVGSSHAHGVRRSPKWALRSVKQAYRSSQSYLHDLVTASCDKRVVGWGSDQVAPSPQWIVFCKVVSRWVGSLVQPTTKNPGLLQLLHTTHMMMAVS
jgi:hypothetical protein